MGPHTTTIGEIRFFIKEHLDKTNCRYNIQKQILDEDIDRYIRGNPYLHEEVVEMLIKYPSCDRIFEEKYEGYVEEVYQNIVVWISSD